jgi:hypothetical protein
MEDIPVLWLFYLLSLGVPLLILTAFHMIYRSEMMQAPFVGRFLRGPGESTLQRINALNDDITTYSSYLFILPILILLVTIIFSGQIISFSIFIAGTFLYLLLIVISGANLWRRLILRRFFRIRYDGKVAVAQEITQLMLDGHHVYHDFPADDFNIDHIIVGPSGVFAIETKVRSKRLSKKGPGGAILTYNGKSIGFPNSTDTDSLWQAERQSLWLQKWLSEAVGDPVKVWPILTFPGWFVERTSPEGIPVLSPKDIRGFLNAQKKNVLSDNMLQRISYQLEQKCRDILPSMVHMEKQKWELEDEEEGINTQSA